MSIGIKSIPGQPSGEILVNGETSLVFSGDSIIIPKGMTSDRPNPPQEGMIRFNSETKVFETYDGSAWSGFSANLETFTTGPISSTDGAVVLFDGATGRALKSGVKFERDLVTGPASSTDGFIPVFDGATGKALRSSTRIITDLLLGPISSTDGFIPVFEGASGKVIRSSGTLITNVVVGPPSSTDGVFAVFNGTSGKVLQSGTLSEARVVQQTGVNGAALIPSGTTGQQPSPPSAGMLRFNTTLNSLEVRDSISWKGVVTGPESSINGNLSVFDGISGKVLTQITRADLASDSAFTNAFSPLLFVETTTRTSNYTLSPDDSAKVIPLSSASAITVTAPLNSSVPIPIGTVINLYRAGTGAVTISAASGVTVRNAGSIRNQFGEVSLRKRLSDEWVLTGDIV